MTEDEATIYFHCFIIVAYSLPMIGGWVADSWLGKFRIILYTSVVYACGTAFMAFSSLGTQLRIPGRVFCLIGLLLIATGTGAIKPCIAPFGADQFVLPNQKKQLDDFFSFFYWCINVGSLLACFLSPFIRSNVKCFGDNHCYPLAFCIPLFSMISALVIFASGKKWYIIKEARRNVVTKFFCCLGYSFWKKITTCEYREHWLDHADDKFENELIEDTKKIIRVFTVISPAIIFWALNDKQSSRWTFQARSLNGNIVGKFKIEPDQMATISSLLVLPAVPLFQKVIYPLMGKLSLCTSLLCRMSLGGYMMGLTFILAAVLQFQVEKYKNEFKLSIAWQLPQYVLLVCAEILFIISGTNFAYTQSPKNMKTLVTSLWFLTVSLGNGIACIIAGIGIRNLVLEFIIDSSIMGFFMTVFSLLAIRFKKFAVETSSEMLLSELTITSRN